MTFGENIRSLRIKNNMRQKELADKLYVTPQTISKWENDFSEPDFKMIQKLIDVFQVSHDTLFKGENDFSYEGVLYTVFKDTRMRRVYHRFILSISILIVALMFTSAHLYTLKLPSIFFIIHIGVVISLIIYVIVLFQWKKNYDNQPKEILDIHPNKLVIKKPNKEILFKDIDTIKLSKYQANNGLRIFDNTGVMTIIDTHHKKTYLRDVLDIQDIQKIIEKIQQ